MKSFTSVAAWSAALFSLPQIVSAWPGQPYTPIFNNVTIFSPPASWTDKSTSYARTVLLNQNCEQGTPVLLSTFAQSPPDGPYFSIFKSTNEGQSWSEISQVRFNAAPTGIILQPFLYELPQPFGKYPAGTVLLAGNAIPGTFDSTNIQLYASADKGYTWEFVSTVAVGTGPNTTNGATPIWEPFILAHDNQLGVWYSDQRDPLHGQKLAHQTSTDLMNWGPVVNDAAFANYTQRPGMITIAKLGNTGKWICSFEVAFATEDPINAPYASHYKIADSPFAFGPEPAQLIQAANTGTISSAGPYTVWTPVGGPNGTIVTSDSTFDQLFLNTAWGEQSAWQEVPSGHGVGYTRALQVMPNEKVILLTNGGMYGANVTMASTGDYIVPGAPSHQDTISSCNRGGHHGW